MPFDWNKYLLLAQFLAKFDDSKLLEEACKRTAVSRAYFAAFCHARNYARDRLRFVPTDRPEDHQRLRAWLKMQGTTKMTNIALVLQNLRQWRNRCDYEDTLSGLNSMVLMALREAQSVINDLQ